MTNTLTAARAESFARAAAERMGASSEDAARMAELLVRAEVGGHPGHGLRRLSQYTNGWQKGTIVPSARPEVVRDDGSTITLDGRRALGQVVCTLAADLASRRALDHGVAAVAVRHSAHAGRLADYADRACGQGAALLVFANDSGAAQAVSPPGGLEARLSTNPLAAGIPRSQAPHLVIDLSTSVVAHGKVRVLEDAGEPVPEAWVRDGLMQPLAGAKGFALGLLVEALAGVVSGAGTVSANPGPDDQGVFMLAFDPGRFGPPADLAGRLDAMLGYVLGVPIEPGAEPLRAPGSTLPALPLDPEARFEIAPALAERLAALASELGIDRI
ncbi:MAG TPA: Ldh family oxidoreductase [Gaiellales bacterium]|nr:Ldh family oxidoreductase [Gaiellales bacterium]